jgi:hypothetical protein
MSTAHGAGLMVAPVLIGAGAASSATASEHDVAHVREAVISPLAGGIRRCSLRRRPAHRRRRHRAD